MTPYLTHHQYVESCIQFPFAELKLEELFRSPAVTSPIFTAVDIDPAGLFTAQEAGVAVVMYAKQQGLEQGASSPAHLMLDVALCDALFKVSPKP